MKAPIDLSVDHGVKYISMDMPHCGRLSILSSVIRKSIMAILNEFSGDQDQTSPAGDVKYYLGVNYVRSTPSG